MPLKKTKSSVQNLFNKAVRNNPHKTSGTGLLYNKYLLYISFIVCIINIVLFMFSGDFISVAIFLLVGYLTSFFSKNMIVILVIALVVSNVIKAGTIMVEGMTDKKDDKKKGKKAGKEGYTNEKDKKGKKSKKEGFEDEGMEDEGMEDETIKPEGLDENAEGLGDAKDTNMNNSCIVDTDCKGGQKCNNGACETI